MSFVYEEIVEDEEEYLSHEARQEMVDVFDGAGVRFIYRKQASEIERLFLELVQYRRSRAPSNWAVDRVNDAFMTRLKGKSFNVPPKLDIYGLGWKGNAIPFEAYFQTNFPPSLDGKCPSFYTIYESSIKIPDALGQDREQIIAAIKDAFSVYQPQYDDAENYLVAEIRRIPASQQHEDYLGMLEGFKKMRSQVE